MNPIEWFANIVALLMAVGFLAIVAMLILGVLTGHGFMDTFVDIASANHSSPHPSWWH